MGKTLDHFNSAASISPAPVAGLSSMIGPPPGYVPPKHQSQQSLLEQVEDLRTRIEVLAPPHVRKRTAEERAEKNIQLLKPVQVRRR